MSHRAFPVFRASAITVVVDDECLCRRSPQVPPGVEQKPERPTDFVLAPPTSAASASAAHPEAATVPEPPAPMIEL